VFRHWHWDAPRRVAAIAACGATLAVWGALSPEAPIRMAMFLAGMLLHEAMVARRVPAPGGAVALVAFAVALAAGARSDLGLAKPAILFAGLFLVCLDSFRRPGGWPARAFGWTPLRWLGNMSYSFYLLHGLCLRAVFLVLAHVAGPHAHGALWFAGVLPVAFAASLIGSGALFLLLERPLSLAVPRGQHAGTAQAPATAASSLPS